MRWRILSTALASILVASGVASCASSGGQSGAGANPDVITAEQILKSKASNAYELIATLRPQMFTAHGAATTRGDQPATKGRQALPPVVYIDNVRVGPIAELHGVSVIDLIEVRYLSPREATDRWGLNHAGGVILLTTKVVAPDTT